MYAYCIIENIVYFCSVIKKQRLQEAAGASQSPAKRSYQIEKGRHYRNAGPEKERYISFQL